MPSRPYVDVINMSNNLDALGKTKVHSYHAGDGPAHLNTETHVKNGANHYDNRETSKSTSFFSRITKDTLFRVFLLLLILALLIPILVLVALIYKQMGTSYMAADSVGTNRMTGSLSGNPDSPNSLAGEEVVAPNGKNTEEVYKKEPWRRDPTGAWKLLGTTLTDSIDPRGDACIDFYGYSCDQWRDRHPLDGRQEISDQTLVSEVVKVSVACFCALPCRISKANYLHQQSHCVDRWLLLP